MSSLVEEAVSELFHFTIFKYILNLSMHRMYHGASADSARKHRFLMPRKNVRKPSAPRLLYAALRLH